MYFLTLFICVLALFVGHFIHSIRLSLLIEPLNTSKSKAVYFKSLTWGYLSNFILPFKVGELIKVYFLSKYTKTNFLYVCNSILLIRLLDFIIVYLISFFMFGFRNDYITIFIIIIMGGMIVLLMSKNVIVKKYKFYISSIFNSTIQFYILSFFWNTQSSQDIIFRKKFVKFFFVTTALQWLCYVVFVYSTSLLIGRSFSSILEVLYAKEALVYPEIIRLVQDGWSVHQIIVYTVISVLPLFILLLLSPYIGRKNSVFVKRKLFSYYNALSKMDRVEIFKNSTDYSNFLKKYFLNISADFELYKIKFNQDVNIIKDISGGSNAITLLVEQYKIPRVRKFAFDESASKLKDQLLWLNSQDKNVKLPKNKVIMSTLTAYCYEMPYDITSITFSKFAHQNKIDKVLDTLQFILSNQLPLIHGKNTAICTEELIKEYYNKKFVSNIDLLCSFPEYKVLLDYPELIINGKTYKNINYFLGKYPVQNWFQSKVKFETSSVHGDFTLENIIVLENDFLIIDPNPENVYNHKFIDFSKLLQSTHFGYEFLVEEKLCIINQNEIRFHLYKSETYKLIFEFIKAHIIEKYGIEGWKDVCSHEIINYARMMPYKVNKDISTSFIFYSILVILLNEKFEENESDIG